MYKIVTTPHRLLVQKTEPVTSFDKKLHDIIHNMEQTLLATTDPKGVGLAAPQVGISQRIFLMKPTDAAPISVFINPIIESMSEENEKIDVTVKSDRVGHAKKKSKSKKKLFEGCLSIPDIWGNVTRKKEVTLSWQDEKGKHHKKMFKGFPATIIQHETDHLNGVLFTTHVMQQGEKLYKSHKNKDGEDEFDEVKI